jgi:predicted secreted protein
MSVTLAIAVYFIIWWTVLFAVLPIGVRTQGEEGSVVPGTPESAPVRPRYLLILGLTTLLSTAVFALVYALLVWGLFELPTIVPLAGG